MRSITKSLKKRLQAQASEAGLVGLTKVAAHLSSQAEEVKVRDDEEEYVYSEEQLKNDVEQLMWTAAVRIQDYYGKTGDAEKIQEIISQGSDELMEATRKTIGGALVGPYEPLTPGELRVEAFDEDLEVHEDEEDE